MHAARPRLAHAKHLGFDKSNRVADPRSLHRGITACVAVAALACFSAIAGATTVTDGFEGFTGASGATVVGYNGWTATSSANAVVENDGTAYQGSYYLRLLEPTTGTSYSATKSFSSTPVSVDGATISFALRDNTTGFTAGTGFTNNQVVMGTTGNTAFQCGIKGEGNNAEFTYSPITGTGATATTPLTAYGTVAANTWYLFNITYSTGGTLAGSYSLTITNTATGTAVYTSTTPLAGQSAYTSLSTEVLTSALTETSSLYAGDADTDSISISNPAPEPASIAGLALLGWGLTMRRRPRNKTGTLPRALIH